jgi:uncharacterized protein (DUF433 family)
MDWRAHITADPKVLVGKPIIRGTRLSVDFLLELLATGWTQEQLLDSYPALTPESLRAVFAYARESVTESAFFPLQRGAA